MKLLIIVGARPNFVKIAPLMAELGKCPEEFQTVLLHTGQHYDYQMSEIFFNELNISPPDTFLNVTGETHAVQTANVMVALEKEVIDIQPDMMIVVGDVNSTLAAALVASKLSIPIAHIEAGLRSFDDTMPEEINRVITDRLSQIHFTPSVDANENLVSEGISQKGIYFVGNIMIDTLLKMLPKAKFEHPSASQLPLTNQYALLTLHRPSNVDNKTTLEGILTALERLQHQLPIIWPLHPRTHCRLEQFDLIERLNKQSHIYLVEPLGYMNNLSLMKGAKLVLTDSGGVQEETTALGVSCVTLRYNTERPVTIEQGTNQLAGIEPERIYDVAMKQLSAQRNDQRQPLYWDGKTAKKIVQHLYEHLDNSSKICTNLFPPDTIRRSSLLSKYV